MQSACGGLAVSTDTGTATTNPISVSTISDVVLAPQEGNSTARRGKSTCKLMARLARILPFRAMS